MAKIKQSNGLLIAKMQECWIPVDCLLSLACNWSEGVGKPRTAHLAAVLGLA